ncbi:MAG TPA: ATP-binding protein [Polyangiaceae bacterium]
MKNRVAYRDRLLHLLGGSPVVALLGPRQCGKTTLARSIVLSWKGTRTFFDLERPSDLERLSLAPEDDLGRLQRRPGIICLDEIQRAPHLFPLLRALVDDPKRRARYLLLGSTSTSVVKGVSESLAGRVSFLDLTPFLATEVEAARGARRERLWERGGFPPSFTARSVERSFSWRENYVRTLLERDLPALGVGLPSVTLHRLLMMLAHLHGGILNASEVASSLSISAPTVSRYLDLLEGAFLARRLPPFWANVGKRLTKAPKIYLRDTGLLHVLLGLRDGDALRAHPKVGASWEGWVVEQLTTGLYLAGEPMEAHYWRTHGGAEADLVLVRGSVRIPLEIKLGTGGRPTRGLYECKKDLAAPHAFVVHGGEDSYPVGDGVWALSAALLADPSTLARVLVNPGAALRT